MLAIGLALILGVLVQPASACGLLYMLTLLFAANYPGPKAPTWQYFGASLEHLVPALCFATFLFADAEAVLSSAGGARHERVHHNNLPSEVSKRGRRPETKRCARLDLRALMEIRAACPN